MDLKGKFKAEHLDFILYLLHELGLGDAVLLSKGLFKSLQENPVKSLNSEEMAVIMCLK
jgi:hypothetical protein